MGSTGAIFNWTELKGRGSCDTAARCKSAIVVSAADADCEAVSSARRNSLLIAIVVEVVGGCGGGACMIMFVVM